MVRAMQSLTKRWVLLGLLSLWNLVPPLHAALPFDPQLVFTAMEAEMRRAEEKLQLPDAEKPYYIEYTLRSVDGNVVLAEYGAVRSVDSSRVVELSVGVRVGSYRFDNTNFLDVGLQFFGSGDDEEPFHRRSLPRELQLWQLRRELWLATDAAYKRAAEAYAKKVAALRNRVQIDTIPDFAPMPPAQFVDTVPYPRFEAAKFIELCRSLSAFFAQYPFIQRDRVLVEYLPKTVYYLNSEGRRMLKTELYCGFEMGIAARSTDGMPIVETYAARAFRPEELPSRDSLFRVARRMVERLRAAQKAPLLDVYNGPVLFEGQAAAELFVYGFLPHLVAQRPWISDQGTTQPVAYGAFQNKIGGRVLPEFLSMDVIPHHFVEHGTPCVGSYRIDDEAVPSKEFRIIEKGYLKGLLSSRVPTRRVRQSNGHQRGGAPIYSTLQLVVEDKGRQKPRAALRQQLLELVKMRELPYGIVVRKVLTQNLLFTMVLPITFGEYPFSRDDEVMPLLEVYKLYPDGSEELVRGAELSQLVPYLFKDIIAVGTNTYVHNFLAPAVVSPFLTGGTRYLPATFITPDILVEEAELRKVEGDYSQPPVLPPPK